MIGVGLLRGVFLGSIMLWYTLGVWKTVDQYFRDQFQEYLTKELEENPTMKKDILEDREKLIARKTLAERLAKLEFSKSLDSHVKPSEGDGGSGGDGPLIQDELECVEPDIVAKELDEDGVHLPEEKEDTGVRGREDYGRGGTSDNVYRVNSDVMEEVDDGDTLCKSSGGEECVPEGDDGIDQGDEEAGKWRSVFDEDEEVCRFEDLGARSSCIQADELGAEANEVH